MHLHCNVSGEDPSQNSICLVGQWSGVCQSLSIGSQLGLLETHPVTDAKTPQIKINLFIRLKIPIGCVKEKADQHHLI